MLLSIKKRKFESTMQKTPASILQEMMVKKGTSPAYELIHNGGGTHENTFTYKVFCEGLTTTGTGRCKKDAKHTAAKNMLEAIAKHNGLLPLPASPMDSPVRTPVPKPMPKPHMLSPNEPFVNAIGELQDLCAECELEDPKYETISDTGPPHARVFTIKCSVSSFVEQGSSTTKKQAKHEAAKKMYGRIREIIISNGNSMDYFKTSEENVNRNGHLDEEKLARVINLFPKKLKLGVKISQYHTKLIEDFKEHIYDIIKSLSEFRKSVVNNEIKFVELKDKFKEAVTLLNTDIDIESFPIENTNHYFVAVIINTTPELVEIKTCDDIEKIYDITKNAIIELIDSLLFMLNQS